MSLRQRYPVAVAVSCLWLLPAAVWVDLNRKEYRQRAGLDPIASFPFGYYRDRMEPVVWAFVCVAVLYWLGEGIAWLHARRVANRKR
jgi:hypothetical protein